MNSPYNRTHRVTPTGIATASILLVTLLMAASLLVDQSTAQPYPGTAVAQAPAQVGGNGTRLAKAQSSAPDRLLRKN
jgi:hypothetical protein